MKATNVEDLPGPVAVALDSSRRVDLPRWSGTVTGSLRHEEIYAGDLPGPVIEPDDRAALDASIRRGLEQADRGEGYSVAQVLKRLRSI